MVNINSSTTNNTGSSNLLTLTGLASGIDTESMVTQLMNAARIPRDQVFQQQQWVEWQQDSYRDINTAMKTFQTAEEQLRFQSSFNPYSATSSDTTAVTVTPGTNVLQGTYQVQIISTATAATLISGSTVQTVDANSNTVAAKSSDKVLAAGTTASFQIQPPTPTGGTTPTPVTINIDENDTFQSVASKITNAGIGLKASFDDTTSRFVLTATNTGDLGKYTISDVTGSVANSIVKGGLPTSGTQLSANDTAASFQGTDADVKITPPGATSQPIEVTQSTNNISALGLNLSLLNTTGSNSITVNVKTDTDAVFNQIKGFVDAYNTLIDTINTKLNEKRNRDYPPLTDDQRKSMTDSQINLWEAKAKSGTLSHDPTLRDIADRLRTAINTPVQSIGSNSIRTLSSIGIGTEFIKSNGTLVTDSDNSGKLQIDETKLRDAIANHPDDVRQLFTISDPLEDYSVTPPVKARTDYEGIGSRFYDIVNNSISKLKDRAGIPGTSYVSDSALGQQVKDLTEQLNNWDDRLSSLQDRYNKQFAAMETIINQFNSQSGYLSQAMG